MSNSDELTLLQKTFLQRFFATETGQRFFLTGGTALAAFHLHHRVSEALDLFTYDDAAMSEIDRLVPRIAQEMGCRIGRTRKSEYFRQFLLEPEKDDPPLKLDLVREYGPRYGELETVQGVIVDAIENIGANKVTAIFGRTASKDFVDLYFILQTGYEFAELLNMAREKDTGLVDFYLAGALLQINKITRLPVMQRSIDLAQLREFFTHLANELLDQLDPTANSK
jgi:hypothetical protein